MVIGVVRDADKFGREISNNVGDSAYRAIHNIWK